MSARNLEETTALTRMRVWCLLNPHSHEREGDVMGPAIDLAYQGGARLLGPMPNTSTGNQDASTVLKYHEALDASAPTAKQTHFIRYLQITEKTTRETIDACVAAGIMDAKIYPKGRTTASHNGVQHYHKLLPIIAYAGEKGMRIHFHPEYPWEVCDSRDAEYLFIPIIDMFMDATNATIVWEHGTDARCIKFWMEWAKTGRFFVTLTGHHLVGTESNTYGDVDAACKPPYRLEDDRRGLHWLIRQGFDWVMAGGDDAPHPKEAKHKIGQCACGAYTAPFLLALYAHALVDMLTTPWGLENFNKFIFHNARKLYGLTGPFGKMLVTIGEQTEIPLSYKLGSWEVIPFWAGRELNVSVEPLHE